MSFNPYTPPGSIKAAPRGETWHATLLAPFLSSVLSIPLGLAAMGVFRRAPDLLSRADFLLPLVSGAILASLLLRLSSSATWLVRAILAPPLAFLIYFLILVVLSTASA